MPKKQKEKPKGGTRKYGRNKIKCERYRREGRREKNKARRAAQRERKYARNRERRKFEEEKHEASDLSGVSGSQ